MPVDATENPFSGLWVLNKLYYGPHCVQTYLLSCIPQGSSESLCLSPLRSERSVAPPPRCDPWLLENGGVCLTRQLDVS